MSVKRLVGYHTFLLCQLKPQMPEKTGKQPSIVFPALGTIFDCQYPDLWKHQIEMADCLHAGEDVLCNAPTGSGKSEPILFYVLEQLLLGHFRTILFLFPTVLLANQMERRLQKLLDALRKKHRTTIAAQCYHGRVPRATLEEIEKQKPQILVATPDKLFFRAFQDDPHEFLPHLYQADLVWLDEAHQARGTFGTHLELLLRGLRAQNSRLQIVLTSATLTDPADLRRNFQLRVSKVIHGRTRRGIINVSIVLQSDLEELLRIQEKRIQILHRRTLPGEDVPKLLTFTNSRADAEQLIHHMKTPSNNLSIYHSDIGTEELYRNYVAFEQGEVTQAVGTSMSELGMDFQNVQVIINLNFPITGINGLVQRLGRIRFAKPTDSREFFLVLDPNNAMDSYWWEHQNELRNLLEKGGVSQRGLLPLNHMALKAFLLHQLQFGPLAWERFVHLASSEAPNAEDRHLAFLRIRLELIMRGVLSLVEDAENRPAHLVCSDPEWVHDFIRNYSLRSGVKKWPVLCARQDGKRESHWIDASWIPFRGLPGNVIFRDGRIWLIKQLLLEKCFLKAQEIPNQKKPKLRKNRVRTTVYQGRFVKKKALQLGTAYYGKALYIYEPRKLWNPFRETFEAINPTDVKRYTFKQLNPSMSIEFTPEEFEQLMQATRMQGTLTAYNVLYLLYQAILTSARQNVAIEPSETTFGRGSQNTAVYFADRGDGQGTAALLFQNLEMILRALRKQSEKCSCEGGCPACVGLPPQKLKGTKVRQIINSLVEAMLG